jgi:hypothetical protein
MARSISRIFRVPGQGHPPGFQRCRFKDMSRESSGLSWTVARAKHVPLADSTEGVRVWRAKQISERRPSTFKDYCAAHGRCLRCESTGIVLDEAQGGFKSAGSTKEVQLFERCPACDGTGVEAARPSWRRKVEEIDRT